MLLQTKKTSLHNPGPQKTTMLAVLSAFEQMTHCRILQAKFGVKLYFFIDMIDRRVAFVLDCTLTERKAYKAGMHFMQE